MSGHIRIRLKGKMVPIVAWDTGPATTEMNVCGFGGLDSSEARAIAAAIMDAADKADVDQLIENEFSMLPAASASLPATSHEAARSMESHVKQVRKGIAGFLRDRPQGATDDEIEQGLNLKHQTASAARRGLVIAGLVRDSGEVRKTRSGRNAIVWVSTQATERAA
jgi:hypothetical protein